MDLTISKVLADISSRLSTFLRREILSVVLPGFMILVGLSVAIVRPTRGSRTSPGQIVSDVTDSLTPGNRVAQLLVVVTLAYFTYGVGAIVRQSAVLYALGRRYVTKRKWIIGAKVDPHAAEREYVQEVCNVRASLYATFGEANVRDVFRRHGLETVFHDRPHDLARLTKEERVVPACTRPVDSTRLEFMYCKAWLCARKSSLGTEHFEYQINVLCALIVPLVLSVIIVGEYAVMGRPAQWEGAINWAFFVAIASAVFGGVVGAIATFKRVVQRMQRDENFDTLRNFFFHQWMESIPEQPVVKMAEAAET